MTVHSIKTDNYKIENKIKLRQLATKDLTELKILDLFAGKNMIWSSFKMKKYYGVEKEKNKGKNLNADNIRIIPILDLSEFNVIDVDSYGIPVNQIAEIYKNKTLQKGTIIIYTCITNKMSSLNKVIIENFGLSKIYKKAQTLINGFAKEFFYAYLYSKGVKKVYEYQVKSSFDKSYGYFIVE